MPCQGSRQRQLSINAGTLLRIGTSIGTAGTRVDAVQDAKIAASGLGMTLINQVVPGEVGVLGL
jgi:hypothetical protein